MCYCRELAEGQAAWKSLLPGQGAGRTGKGQSWAHHMLSLQGFSSWYYWVPRKHSKKLINFLSSAATAPANSLEESIAVLQQQLPSLSYSNSYFVLTKMKCQVVTEKNILLMLSSNWVSKVLGSGGNGGS